MSGKDLAYTTSIVGLGALLAWGLFLRPPLDIRDPSDPDRPPIIVSDGSVDMYILRDTRGRVRGYLQEGQNGSDYYLEHRFHENKAPAKSFAVSLENAVGTDSNKDACEDVDRVFSVPTFTILVGQNEKQSYVVTVTIESGNLRATSNTKPNQHKRHWKHLGDGNDRLLSVSFPKTTADPAYTCTFAKGSQRTGVITIGQSQVEVR